MSGLLTCLLNSQEATFQEGHYGSQPRPAGPQEEHSSWLISATHPNAQKMPYYFIPKILGEVEDENDGSTVPVERFDNRPKGLLSSSIPNLQLDFIILQFQCFSLELSP